MVKLDIKLDLTQFNQSLKNMSKAAQNEAEKAITAVAYKVEGDAKENIQTGGRTGRIYKRGKKGKIKHQASAVGEFPKTDNEALVEGITAEFSFSGLEATVGSRISAPHGYWLEFGTRKMRARPWLSRTIDDNKDFIDRRFEKALSEIAKEFKS